jgi:hypothetical protein
MDSKVKGGKRKIYLNGKEMQFSSRSKKLSLKKVR